VQCSADWLVQLKRTKEKKKEEEEKEGASQVTRVNTTDSFAWGVPAVYHGSTGGVEGHSLLESSTRKS
jgi:hypothetical protein